MVESEMETGMIRPLREPSRVPLYRHAQQLPTESYEQTLGNRVARLAMGIR